MPAGEHGSEASVHRRRTRRAFPRAMIPLAMQNAETTLMPPISNLPSLTDADRHRILVEWNATDAEFPRLCAHELFERQVARTPDAIAVAFGSETLTYAELNVRANRLARWLRQQGTGAESLVGLYVERSLEMVVGLLAILKSGGAYVPIDPAYPKDRIAFVLADSGARLVLTQSSLMTSLAGYNGERFCLDTDWPQVEAFPECDLAAGSTIDNLAYVIYTSGSTGLPKGVMITHRALANFLCSMQSCPGLTARDTLLAITTLSFDIAGLELLLPLIVG